MKKLIVHIEYGGEYEDFEDAVEEVMDGLRENFGGDDSDLSYRLFGSLEEAGAWEHGGADVEFKLVEA